MKEKKDIRIEIPTENLKVEKAAAWVFSTGFECETGASRMIGETM